MKKITFKFGSEGTPVAVIDAGSFEKCFSLYKSEKMRNGVVVNSEPFYAIYTHTGRWAWMMRRRDGFAIYACFAEDVEYPALVEVIAHEVDHYFKQFFTVEESEASARFTGGVSRFACEVAEKLLE